MGVPPKDVCVHTNTNNIHSTYSQHMYTPHVCIPIQNLSLVHHDKVVMHSCSGQCGPSSSWDNCISSCWNIDINDLPVTICCGVGGPLSSLGLETTVAMFSVSWGTSAGSMAVTL